jgi:FAD/FMN-containing dehydrogenase
MMREARGSGTVHRRAFLAAAGLGAVAARSRAAAPVGVLVNDVHSALNPTLVHEVLSPRSPDAVAEAVGRAAATGRAVSVCGSRHAMGGQAFGTDTVLLDLRGLAAIGSLDPDSGSVEVEAGVEWPELVGHLVAVQRGRPASWGIVQKQTGADRLTIGGALAANVHGRGLTRPPFVGDVLWFDLVDGRGAVRRCSRTGNADLFGLAIGGYGLFGIVTRVGLKLAPRRKVERVVELAPSEEVVPRVEERIAAGYLYGDFQFAIDPESPDFLRRGVFSCYRPVSDDTPIPAGQKELGSADWRRLLGLAHTDRSRAFREYAAHYLATSGQVYWSDTHQMSGYEPGYHARLDREKGAEPGSEMITEVYVPRSALEDLLAGMRTELRANGVGLVYGTVRFIEPDRETFLPWAGSRWACVVVNLHVPAAAAGRARAADAFRALIDLAQSLGGSYYLTYHRHARRDQVLRSYPQFPAFLQEKKRLDPEERFQSDWYRHYRAMFGPDPTSRV